MKKTIKGIHLDINPEVLTDLMTVEMFADVMTPLDEGGTSEEKAEAQATRIRQIMALSRRIYGDDFDRVYRELANKHGGYVSADEWSKFLNQTLEEYQKNPNARPAPSPK